MDRYYLVTDESHELEGFVGIETRTNLGDGCVELSFGNLVCAFYTEELTEITESDFNVIEDELSTNESTRLNEIYRKLANGTYAV